MVQFRVKALNQMQKPDDLDLLMKVTKRQGWVGLAVLGIALAGLTVWGFTGSVPVQIAGKGMIAAADGVDEIQSQVSGFITEVSIEAGQFVEVGDTIARLESGGELVDITARFAGEVTAVLISVGKVIDIGDTLYLTVRSEAGDGSQAAFVFVPADKVASVAPGMSVDLKLDAVPPAAFGVLRGKVTSVNSSPLDRAAIISLLSNAEFADSLLDDGEPVLVTVSLNTDPSTPSGYEWSTKTGPPFAIPAAARFTALITQGDTRPIDLVFGG